MNNEDTISLYDEDKNVQNLFEIIPNTENSSRTIKVRNKDFEDNFAELISQLTHKYKFRFDDTLILIIYEFKLPIENDQTIDKVIIDSFVEFCLNKKVVIVKQDIENGIFSNIYEEMLKRKKEKIYLENNEINNENLKLKNIAVCNIKSEKFFKMIHNYFANKEESFKFILSMIFTKTTKILKNVLFGLRNSIPTFSIENFSLYNFSDTSKECNELIMQVLAYSNQLFLIDLDNVYDKDCFNENILKNFLKCQKSEDNKLKFCLKFDCFEQLESKVFKVDHLPDMDENDENFISKLIRNDKANNIRIILRNKLYWNRNFKIRNLLNLYKVTFKKEENVFLDFKRPKDSKFLKLFQLIKCLKYH